MQGLNVNRIVKVDVNLSPKAVPTGDMGVLLAIGDSDVINTKERIRSYTDADSVLQDFDVNAPESKAAALYFGQDPKPRTLMVGRWARTDTAGVLLGDILTTEEQDIAKWKKTDLAFSVAIDGAAAKDVTADLSGVANLNAVAAAFTTALAGATMTWDGQSFKVVSKTQGAASSISYLAKPKTGTDCSAMLKMTSATAKAVIDGIKAETAIECIGVMMGQSNRWRGVAFTASTQPGDTDNLAIANLIEASTVKRLFGITSADSKILNPQDKTDIASQLKDAKYNSAIVQYSTTEPFAIVSLFGCGYGIDWTQVNSHKTLKFKQEPGVKAEDLSETQAQALESKNCDVYAHYDNDADIIQEGVCSSGAFIDEMLGLYAIVNDLEVELFNLFYTSAKIPQTDEGSAIIANTCSAVCGKYVSNGFLGTGKWDDVGFGQLKKGDTIEGFYVYIQPMASQLKADREARKSPPVKVAVKLAGAVHSISAVINVNR